MLVLNNLAGFSASSGRDGSFMGILQRLGLTSGLKLCLDAGDLASFPSSTSQKWLDRSGGGHDFFRGVDAAAAADDPTFNGVVGKLSSAEYFSTDGGDSFTYDTAQESWMSNLAKNNATFTLLAWVYPQTASGDDMIFGTMTPGGGLNGIAWMLNANKNGFLCFNDIAYRSYTGGSVSSLNSHSVSQWHLFGLSYSEATGANGAFFYRDGEYDEITGPSEKWDSTYSSSEPSANSNPAYIFSLGPSYPMVANTRIAGLMIWEGIALTKSQLDKIWNASRARFGLYNGTWTGTAGAPASMFGGGNGNGGLRFTANESASISSVEWNISTASGSDNITAYIYSDDGGSPSSPATLMYTSSYTQSTASSGVKAWTFAGASITSGIKYWIVLSTGGGTATPAFSTVANVPGFNSGRHATITSIDSSGQAPDTTSEDWKVKIVT